jgi:hypothetical protein
MTENTHNVLIYRMKNEHLEVFVLPQTAGFGVPQHDISAHFSENSPRPIIELEPIENEDGSFQKSIAVEADWHEIPSLRALIREDYEVAKDKLKHRLREFLPAHEGGAYMVMKEAAKKAAPDQYQLLKELKDILLEKNAVKYI